MVNAWMFGAELLSAQTQTFVWVVIFFFASAGALIGDGTSRTGLVGGYVIGRLIMVLGGVVELAFGIKAERQSLETVTKPLTAVSD